MLAFFIESGRMLITDMSGSVEMNEPLGPGPLSRTVSSTLNHNVTHWPTLRVLTHKYQIRIQYLVKHSLNMFPHMPGLTGLTRARL